MPSDQPSLFGETITAVAIPDAGQIEAMFLMFWRIFPKRTGSNSKHDASVKFAKLVKSGENPQNIIGGAERFARECVVNGTTGKFVPMAVTWLNKKRWRDDPDQDPTNGGRGPAGSGSDFLDIAQSLYDAGSDQHGDYRTVPRPR